MEGKDNFEIDRKNRLVMVSVNPKIYPMPAIFSASYFMMDKAFVVLDGNESQVVVSLRPRQSQGLEDLARIFNDELLNCAVNQEESRKTETLRNEIIKQAFAGHSSGKK